MISSAPSITPLRFMARNVQRQLLAGIPTFGTGSYRLRFDDDRFLIDGASHADLISITGRISRTESLSGKRRSLVLDARTRRPSFRARRLGMTRV